MAAVKPAAQQEAAAAADEAMDRNVASDIAAVKAHGTEHASHGLGAKAFAEGNSIKFAEAGNLRVAAHEASHTVQQGAAAPVQR